MKIVYDLRYATEHFPGVGTFAFSLFAALLALPAADHFLVLWDAQRGRSAFDVAGLRNHPRTEWCDTSEPPLGWRAPFTTGALLRRLRGDVYLSPFYVRPVGSPMPVVLTLHDAMHLAPESGSPWGMRVRFALAMRHARGAAAMLTVSESARADLVRLAGIPAARLHVVPNGVPPRHLGAAERPAGVPDRPFALVVGVNRPHKNHALLARVWQDFGADPPLDLVAAGPVDPRFPSLRQLTGAPTVHQLGRVSAAQLEWLYAHATLLVFPTRHEGFGLPVIEAADRGLPVVASDLPALRETGGEAVRYVSAQDSRAWMAAVSELAADPDARQRMRVAGRAQAVRFSYAESAARARHVLQEVVAGATA